MRFSTSQRKRESERKKDRKRQVYSCGHSKRTSGYRMFRPGIHASGELAKVQRRLISLKVPRIFSLNKFKLIPQPPGYIVGTVNEPTKVPEADFGHGSYHWDYERLLAVALVPLSVTPFVSGVELPLLDSLLSLTILLHSHIGFTSCIIDYLPKRVYGIWHNLATYLLTLGTSVGVYGIYVMETTDSGLTNLIRKLWRKPEETT